MSELLTPWFPSHIRPVHIGYYDTRTDHGEMVLFWDGKEWRASKYSPRNCYSAFYLNREWRGLVKPAPYLHNDMFALAA